MQVMSMQVQDDPNYAISEIFVCREVVTESKWFPSFSPDDFPACHEAAQKALSLAQATVAADTTGSKVTCTNIHL